MDVPPDSMVVGVPGRIVRSVDEATHHRIQHAWQHYVEQARRHRDGAFPILPPTTAR
jgi:carbonic anhydrase/acetyltransferase-like protein (isoleucine patch superfamily)